MKTVALFMLAFAFTTAFASSNKNIETKAKISHVTIYNSSAEIGYNKEVSLAPGKTTVVFTGLTADILPNTIKVSLTNKEVNIVKVTEKLNFVKKTVTKHDREALRDSIVQMGNTIGLLSCKISALSDEKDLLFRGESLGGLTAGIAVTEIEKASDFYAKRNYTVTKKLYLLNAKVDRIRLRMTRYQKQVSQHTTTKSEKTSEIYVTVMNRSPRKVRFNFSFLTAKAGWAPAYDFRYQGVNKPLEFVFRANVFNATGNGWDNVRVKLSTATPTKGFNLPNLSTSTAAPAVVGKVKINTIEVVNAIAEYDIVHRYSIPSDGKPYLVDVNKFEITADFNYLLIPKLDPFGFLMAKIPAWNKYNLIPGTTNIYNKGSYMGKTFLNTYAANDTLSLFLGKDKNVRAVKEETTDFKENGIIGNYTVDKSDVKITVQNYSETNYPVQVLDQVPIFEKDDDTKFSIDFELADYDKREGSLVWTFDLKAESSKEIHYHYKIKSPKDAAVFDTKPRRHKFRTIACPSF